MNQFYLPIPIGIENIKNIDGITYTLTEIVHIKKKINEIINNSQQKVTERIDLNNIIDYTILYEYYQYSDLIQPCNLIKFFSYILNLYSTTRYQSSIKYLSKEEFNSLNCIKFGNCDVLFDNTTIEKQNKCPICIKKFMKNSKVIVLNCKHIYHYKCLSQWLLNSSNKCPLCKQFAC
jgi:hypothetical protein